jgi:hypothetical protein
VTRRKVLLVVLLGVGCGWLMWPHGGVQCLLHCRVLTWLALVVFVFPSGFLFLVDLFLSPGEIGTLTSARWEIICVGLQLTVYRIITI